jgi:hypothetical protein
LANQDNHTVADILSLSRARKAKAKAGKQTAAQANRLKFGRTKAEKAEAAAKDALATGRIDAHKRDKT